MIWEWVLTHLKSLIRWHRQELAQLEADIPKRPLTRQVETVSPTTSICELATLGAPAPIGRPAITPEAEMSDDFVDKILAELRTGASSGHEVGTAETLVKDLTKEQHEQIRERLSTWGTEHHNVNTEGSALYDEDVAFTLGPFETSMILPQIEPMVRAMPGLGKIAIDRINIAKDLDIALIVVGLNYTESNKILPGHALSESYATIWSTMVDAIVNSAQAVVCSVIDAHDKTCDEKLATANWKAYDTYLKDTRKHFGRSPKDAVVKNLFRGLL